MRGDIERWNRKYEERNPHPSFEPDSIVVTHQHLLTGCGKALDVACGVGHNAIFLAGLGYHVLGVDGSLIALRLCRDVTRSRDLPLDLLAMDLDTFHPPADYFDVILVVRFLDRKLIPRLKRALRPSGLVIYQTFNRNLLRQRPTFNEEFLLELGELASLFQDLSCITSNDAQDLEESLTHWIGRKP